MCSELKALLINLFLSSTDTPSCFSQPSSQSGASAAKILYCFERSFFGGFSSSLPLHAYKQDTKTKTSQLFTLSVNTRDSTTTVAAAATAADTVLTHQINHCLS